MRKLFLALLVIPAGLVTAQELKPIALPAPQTTAASR